MKIYFTGSLHNRDIDTKTYRKIVDVLEGIGQKVDTYVFESTADEVDSLSGEQRTKYYQKLKKRIGKAEVMVAEVSYPSTLSIGHEVSLALDQGKPIVAIYKTGREPGLLQGIDSERFILLEYSDDDLKDILEYGLEEADEQMDVRFNFFISPAIGNYLDKISKENKIPRAVYLRQLIERDMESNDEYNEG